VLRQLAPRGKDSALDRQYGPLLFNEDVLFVHPPLLVLKPSVVALKFALPAFAVLHLLGLAPQFVVVLPL